MKKKLTLRMDQEAIERAKAYAAKRDTSVSKLVEQFFDALSKEKAREEVEISPFVESLRGIAADDAGEDDYRDYLEEKHQ
ncbi:MAG: DUF6364 family protein [Persicimonas sp.]